MATWSIINNKSEYAKAMDRVEQLSTMPPPSNSELGKELMLLGYLIQEYESKNFAINFPDPIQAIQARMEQLGFSITDMLDIFGDRGTASKIFNHQRTLSLNMIRSLADKLALPVELLIQPTNVKASYRQPNNKSQVAEKITKYQKARKKLKS